MLFSCQFYLITRYKPLGTGLCILREKNINHNSDILSVTRLTPLLFKVNNNLCQKMRKCCPNGDLNKFMYFLNTNLVIHLQKNAKM